MRSKEKIATYVSVNAEDLYKDIDDIIKGKSMKLLTNKHIKNYGVITDVTNIESIEGGHIHKDNGTSRYKVIASIILYKPIVNEVLNGIVEHIELLSDSSGIEINIKSDECPLDIYIAIPSKKNNKAILSANKVGTKVKCKITKLLYHKDTLKILANLV